ncbi:MAG TPA: carboxypeptidase regulatory-like domain-containing protein [Bryobacteraceae bacterium]|nr:carboxypeptidase regulatory-like domain-containing protein [Bryobacteraceae bacterium]
MTRTISTLILAALFTAWTVSAQSTGSLTGVVRDTQAGAIPGAPVTAENIATGIKTPATTNDAGIYFFPALPVGVYRLTVSFQGFQTRVLDKIRLQVDQRLTADFDLQVASVQEQVMVQTSAVLLETTTSTLSQVVDTKRINDLPLNGRNVLSLLGLQAGVTTRGGSLSYGNAALYPTTAGYQVNNSVNGARGNQTAYKLDGGTNTNGTHGVANPFPSPDAVQEFSVQTSSFSAENGGVVGGVVNVVTKSGTNQFHGSAWEFHRNKVLNARNFFAADADALKRNQFGFGIGGPIRIPKLYDGRNKTFFFGSYQGSRNRRAQSGALATTLTEAQRGGNLAGTAVARDPLTNLPFPNNVIPRDRFDPAVVKFLEYLPSGNDGNLYRFNRPSRADDDDQYVLRLDHYLPGGHQLTGRITRTDFRNPKTYLEKNLFSATSGLESISDNVLVTYTHVVRQNLISINRFTFTRLTLDLVPATDIAVADFGARVPRTTPGNLNIAISGFSAINTGFFNNSFDKNYESTSDWSYHGGKQNVKFGLRMLKSVKRSAGQFTGSGNYTFNGQITGNVISDLLLGKPSNFAMRQIFGKEIYAWKPALYLQDDIRLTPSFTVNLGLRWDPNRPFIDTIDMWPAFRPGLKSQRFVNAPEGLVFSNDAGVSRGVANSDWNNLSPRIGFAWNPRGGRNVMRGAYGIFYDQVFGQTAWRSSAPYVASTAIFAPPSFSNPYGSAAPTNPEQNLNPDKNFIFPAAFPFASIEEDFRSGFVQSYHLTLERRMTSTLVARAAYVGSSSTHLMMSEAVNPALYIPGRSTVANTNDRRPYRAFGNVTEIRDGARAWYNSMQLTLQKQMGNAFTFSANYTLSKSIDSSSFAQDGGVTEGPNPFNRRSNRAVSDFDALHRFNTSLLWKLPFFERSPGVAKTLLGGWQYNTIVNLESGLPYSIVDTRDQGLAGIGAGVRADLVGNPFLDNGRPKSERLNRYFNTNAFALPAEGTFGTSGRNILRGAGYFNVDASLIKEFSFAEQRAIQFRAEFFNLFNRANFGLPTNTLNSPNFGRILSADSPRILQFGLKLAF